MRMLRIILEKFKRRKKSDALVAVATRELNRMEMYK
jgi:hypothetical protein